MKIMHKLFAVAVAITGMTLLAFLPNQVNAQQSNRSHVTPRIEGFNVDEVRVLNPGTDLNFSLYGTPGGQATLNIAGTSRNLPLTEVEPGLYEGTYTISSRDKINARSPVTANLRVGNQVDSMVLNESLQIGVGEHRENVLAGQQPRIERFDIEPITDFSGGNDLRFTVFGTPGGKVDLSIKGVKGKIFLPEVNSGEYTGTYTIKNRDRITSNSTVIAYLHSGDRVASATLDKALQSAAPHARLRAANVCHNCGTVEAINRVEVKGEGGYLGTIGGGVVGALLGSQIGKGKGRTAAEIAAALGGAYAGHTIEGNVRKSYHYEILVRLQNGATQTIPSAVEPPYRVGDKVVVNEGVLSRQP